METSAGIYKSALFPDGFSHGIVPHTPVQKAMLDASVDCIKVISTDGTLLQMNRAGCVALGVAEDSGFGMPWLPLLPDGVHEAGQIALAHAVQGQNTRFPGQSEAEGETRYWDNLLTPVIDEAGEVQLILCVSRDVTAKARLERELEIAMEGERLLAREMRHRIKNVFAVASGLISMCEREAAADPDGASATEILRGRLEALALASDTVFEQSAMPYSSAHALDVGLLVVSVLKPYEGKYHGVGEQAFVAQRDMTTVSLFRHELATNSVKYGALGSEGGRVDIDWRTKGAELVLTWVETGGPAVSDPKRSGFGSAMIDRVVRSAGGSVERAWEPGGLCVVMRLLAAESV